jgi:hypothetical protein
MVKNRLKMKEMKIILIAITVMFSSYSCNKEILTDDKLSFARTLFVGNQLKTDGYYYLMDDYGVSATYFFYQNGIIIHRGGWINNSLEELERNFHTIDWNEIKNNKSAWGIFQIKGNKIEFERWYPSSGGPLPAYIRSGEILNDTTFIITKSIRSKTGEEKELYETYYFKQFSPKPDSTNNFIK